MRCPFCAHEESDVKDSRLTDDGKNIKRRRQCKKCGARFTTFERIVLRELMVIKKNGAIESFQRDKFARSVSVACRKRGIDNEKLEAIISSLVSELEATGNSEVSTQTIGESVMKRLAGLDKVAFIRYASVYKDFDEVKDFENFIEEIDARHNDQKDGETDDGKDDDKSNPKEDDDKDDEKDDGKDGRKK